MATKTTGAELKAFYADDAFWQDGAWHDDEEIVVNGVHRTSDQDINEIDDATQVVVANGVVLGLPGINDDNAPSFENHFKKWRKLQSKVFIVVECPKDIVGAVTAAIVAAGGKVK